MGRRLRREDLVFATNASFRFIGIPSHPISERRSEDRKEHGCADGCRSFNARLNPSQEAKGSSGKNTDPCGEDSLHTYPV